MSEQERPDLPGLVLAEHMEMCLPSRPDWIEVAVEFLRQKAVLSGACRESRAGKLMVALHEALSNAIVHGNLEMSSELKEQGDSSFAQALARRVADPRLADREVAIGFAFDGQRARWTVTDEGNGFDVDGIMRRVTSDDPEVLLASGRGILLMRSFLDEVRYEAGGRRLILELKRESGEEKRRQGRVPLHQPLRVAPIRADGSVDWDAAYEAVSRNLSENGVAVLQQHIAHSDRILIGLVVNDQPFYVPAEVRHCRHLSGEIVELGCRFQTRQRASDDAAAAAPLHAAVTNLLERHSAASPKGERRLHQRAAFNVQVTVTTPASAQPIVGYSRDLSKGGMAFLTTVPLAPETVIVSVPQGEEPPLAVRAQVVRCSRIREGLYDIGVRFLELAS